MVPAAGLRKVADECWPRTELDGHYFGEAADATW